MELAGAQCFVSAQVLNTTTCHPDEVQLLRQEIVALRAQIAWLKQKLFGGGKSESLDQAQLRLKLTELEQLAAKVERPVERITYERTKGVKAPRLMPGETFVSMLSHLFGGGDA